MSRIGTESTCRTDDDWRSSPAHAVITICANFQVYVYMKSNLINNRTKVGKINSHEFISGIGSIMGMYLGYSFLFCWSILDVIGRVVVDAYCAYCKDKRLQQSKVFDLSTEHPN